MILNHISDHYPILKPQDSLSKAQKLFEQFQISFLAIVDRGQFLGFLNKQNLQHQYPDQKIIDLKDDLAKDSLLGENDLFTAIPFFGKYDSKIAPIVDENERFLGYLERDTLGKELIDSDLNLDDGGIIKIQFHQQRDSMAQIFRILEENKALVVKSILQDKGEEHKLPTLMLQVKTQQLGNLVQHLERHGYLIEQSYQLVGSDNFDHSRYESLMKYLTI